MTNFRTVTVATIALAVGVAIAVPTVLFDRDKPIRVAATGDDSTTTTADPTTTTLAATTTTIPATTTTRRRTTTTTTAVPECQRDQVEFGTLVWGRQFPGSNPPAYLNNDGVVLRSWMTNVGPTPCVNPTRCPGNGAYLVAEDGTVVWDTGPGPEGLCAGPWPPHRVLQPGERVGGNDHVFQRQDNPPPPGRYRFVSRWPLATGTTDLPPCVFEFRDADTGGRELATQPCGATS